MKTFKFRLEEFLRIRRHVEKTWEQKLAEATGHCLRLEGRLKEIDSERRENSSCSVGGLVYGIEELYARNAYIRRLDDEAAGTEKDLARRRKEREAVNKEFLEASKNRKVLEKLKERKSREYYKLGLKEEGKVLDDIGSQMKIRSDTLKEE